jgi:hypothetical protein
LEAVFLEIPPPGDFWRAVESSCNGVMVNRGGVDNLLTITDCQEAFSGTS